MQIKLEGVIREIIGSGHRFVCLVRQQIELVLVVFFFWKIGTMTVSTIRQGLET